MPAPDAPAGPPATPSRGRPPILVAVVVAVAVEALVLLAVAGTYVAGVLREGVADLVPALLTAAVALAVGIGLLAAVGGLLRGRRWARAPVITWQLLQSAVLLPALGGPFSTGAIALLVLAAVAVAGLFVPSVVRATSSSAAPPVL